MRFPILLEDNTNNPKDCNLSLLLRNSKEKPFEISEGVQDSNLHIRDISLRNSYQLDERLLANK